VEMVRAARALDLLTTPYVFSEADGAAMAGAGADILIAHMGLTTGGTIGAETALKLADCPALIDRYASAAKQVNPDTIMLCHGGPIATPADAQYILDACRHCDGFYGASSMERLPVETALTERTKEFRALTRRGPEEKKRA
jgi:predicted TIM-barrel enzyme